MARTSLLGLLQRSFRKARLIESGDPSLIRDLLDAASQSRGVSRRKFLRQTAGAAVAAGASTLVPGCRSTPPKIVPKSNTPRIAIVGGGMAGLNAAYTLKKNGVGATVFEASKRTGGRMWSAQNILADGLTTEIGGEFVDSGHEDMFALIKEFELPTLDMHDDAPAGLIEDACYFGNRHYIGAEIVEAFRPIAAKMQQDFDTLGETIDYRNAGNAGVLDQTTLAEYLARLEAPAFLKALLDVAYVTEYGLDADQQSSLNLLTLIGLDTAEGFDVFGDSDERFKVLGGNQRVVDELVARLPNQIVTEHRLTAIRSRGDGFTLMFDRKGAGSIDVQSDFVVMTVPFSVLRDVDIKLELPPEKRKAINELGYGTNAKLMLGFHAPAWRTLGYSGNAVTDEPFQLGWDNSRLQKKAHAGFTMYSGGKAGITVGEGTPAEQAKRLLPGLSAVFPGVADRRNGKVERFHWPSFPHSKGSYACYRPGQWTTIRGAEAEPFGNLHFAGEHCSADFQGFMNGAAETGRLAAEQILAAMRNAMPAEKHISRRVFMAPQA